MAIALVGSAGAVTRGAQPAFGQATTAGNFLVSWCGSNPNSASNPFTIDQGWTVLIAGGSNFNWSAIAYKANCGSSETAPTWTGGTGSIWTCAAEFSGVSAVSPADQFAAGPRGQNMTAQNSAADAAPASLIVGCAYWDTPSTGFTIGQSITDGASASVTPTAYNDSGDVSGRGYYDFIWGVAGAGTPTVGDICAFTLSNFVNGSSCLASFLATSGTVSGAVAPLALAAPAGTIQLSVNGLVSPLALAAPPGSVQSTAVTIAGQVAQLFLAAPAGSTGLARRNPPGMLPFSGPPYAGLPFTGPPYAELPFRKNF